MGTRSGGSQRSSLVGKHVGPQEVQLSAPLLCLRMTLSVVLRGLDLGAVCLGCILALLSSCVTGVSLHLVEQSSLRVSNGDKIMIPA